MSTSMSPQPQRKQATVLFADLSGFTAMSESLDPEQVRMIINRYFEVLSAAVRRYGGTVDKYIGDCVMAVFGAPVSHEDDAVRACRAALDMHAGVHEIAKSADLGVNRPPNLHIGINTGLVVAAPMGTGEAQQFTVMGDAVNLASRLCHEADDGETIIGEATYQSVRHLFVFGSHRTRPIKGKSERVSMYQLVGVGTAPPRRCETVFVGRGAELSAARETLAAAASGTAGVLFIHGEAGIGKSRLTEELIAGASRDGFRSLYATGRRLEILRAYGLWRDLIAGLTGAERDADGSAIASKLDAWLALRPALEPFNAELRVCAGLAVEAFATIDEQERLMRLAQAWGAVFRLLATEQPLLIVLDDLQWADPASLALLDRFVGALAGRVVLSCAARPEYQPVWKAASVCRTIALGPLSQAESASLVHQVLGAKEGEEIALARGEGNPFYLTEMARALRSGGSTALPPTIEGVIMARIDQLEAEARRVIETAAVIGREFPQRLVKAVAASDAVDDQLRALEKLELIYRNDIAPELEYLFKHYLTQQTTYNSILLERRKQLHRQVAEAIEALYSNDLERYYDVLAQHLESAEEYARAFAYYRKAGERAHTNASDATAVALLARGETALEALHRSRSSWKVKWKASCAIAGLMWILAFGLGSVVSTRMHGFSAQREMRIAGLAVLCTSWVLLGMFLNTRTSSTMIYPDRLKVHALPLGAVRTEVPFERVRNVSVVTYPRWRAFFGFTGPWLYNRVGIAQSLTLSRQRATYVLVQCEGLKFGTRGYLVDLDDPQQFAATLERAIKRHRAIAAAHAQSAMSQPI